MRFAICGIMLAWAAVYLYAAARPSVNLSDRFISYQTAPDSFAVVYVDEDESATPEQAKNYAMQRAAEITVEYGYRYFIIDQQQSVVVAKSTPNNNRFPGNLYQELIVEGDFGPNHERNLPSPTGMYSGYKLMITCSKNKAAKGAIDACTITKCN